MRWAVNLYTTEKTEKMLPRIMQKLKKTQTAARHLDSYHCI